MGLKVGKVVFVVVIFLLIRALLKSSDQKWSDYNPSKQQNVDLSNFNYKKSLDYYRRTDFPKPVISWFETHTFNYSIPNLQKHQLKSDSVFQRRWRDADTLSYGVLNRGIDVDETTKFQTKEDHEEFSKKFQQHQFNGFASDRISLYRDLHDPRLEECKDTKHLGILPSASIILCFHNEAWSTLTRSVLSVINKTPAHLLHEIILVDDASELSHLKGPLENFAARVGKTRIIRSPTRTGLIRARLVGASIAKGDVLLFLDSHIECVDGWIEPLLDRIARKRTTVVVPTIDVINDEDLSYRYTKTMQIGGFDWSLVFTWHNVPDEQLKTLKPSEPVPSPTMAGGLFAIDREYFDYLGAYDEGMDIWGGENIEISLRIWMCGGTLEQHPCSHVGHIFRKISPYQWRPGVDVVRKNNVRLAQVWMDGFEQLYYDHTRKNDGEDVGDLTERKELRKRLKCKSFKWYMNTIYPSLFKPWDSIASGEVKSTSSSTKCLDGPKASVVTLLECHGQRGNQQWYYTKVGEFRTKNDMCLDSAGKINDPQGVVTYACHGSKGNQWWEYTDRNTIIHRTHSLCLEARGDQVALAKCEPNKLSQQWQVKREPYSTIVV